MKKPAIRIGIVLLSFFFYCNIAMGQLKLSHSPVVNSCDGGDISFTIMIQNDGTTDAFNESVSFPLSSTLFDGIQFAGDGTYNSGVWTMDIPAGGSASITVTATNKSDISGVLQAGLSSDPSVSTQLNYVVNPKPNVSVKPLKSPLCFGTSTILEASSTDAIVDYYWPHNQESGANMIAFPITTTPYTVEATDVNGCKNSASTTIVVHQLPDIDGTDPKICIGESVTITATGSGYAYIWLDNNSTSKSRVVSPTKTTIYPLSGVDHNGCVNSGSSKVTVYEYPVLDPIGDQTICSEELTAEIPLSATHIPLPEDEEQVHYSWKINQTNGVSGASGGGGEEIPETQLTLNPSFTVPGSVTYEVYARVWTCTSDPEYFTVNVKPLPTVKPITPQEICDEESTAEVVLSSNLTGADFSWTVVADGVTGATDGNGPSIPVTALTLDAGRTTPGKVTYTIDATFDGCDGKTPGTFEVTVNPMPETTPVPPQSICSGTATSPAPLSANLPGATFSWKVIYVDGVIGAAAGSGNSIPATLLALTPPERTIPGKVIYEITTTAGNCSDNKETFEVTVNPGPVVDPITTAPSVLCSEEKLTEILLTSTPPGANFNWIVTLDGVTGPTDGNGTKIPETQLILDAGRTIPGKVTYTIIPNIGGCIGAPVNLDIDVNPTPTASFYYDDQGDVTGFTGQTGGTYDATPAGLDIDPVTGKVNPGTSTDGSYTVTYSFSNAYGCNNTFSVSVVISSGGITSTFISYNSNMPLCAKGEAHVTQIGQTGGTYSVAPAGLSVNPASGKLDLENSTPGIYTVSYEYPYGMTTKTTTTTVTVNSLPKASILYQSQHVCKNTYGEASIEMQSGAAPYRTIWTIDNTVHTDTYTNDKLTVNNLTSGNYQIRVIDNNNCDALFPLNVSIQNDPAISLYADDVKEACIGSSFDLKIAGINNLNIHDIVWEYSDNNDGTWHPISQQPTMHDIAKEDREYRITAKSEHNCLNTSAVFYKKTRKQVDDLTLSADKYTIQPGETITLKASTLSNLPLVWSEDVDSNDEIRLYKDKQITVKVSDDVCDAVSASVDIKVLWPNAITPYDKDGLNDEFVPDLDCKTVIFNRYGQKVYEGSNGWDGTYRKKLADPGTYYYVVELPDGEVKKGTIDVVKIK